MFRSALIFSVFATTLSASAAAESTNDNLISVDGILRTDLVGLGGETTGIGIETPRGMNLLILPREYHSAAFNEKVVRLKGKEITLHYVETGDRHAIEVSEIAFFPKLENLTGKLEVDFALGGETTGFRITTSDGKIHQLALTQWQQGSARDLLEHEVKVEGIFSKRVYSETGVKYILVVEKISPVTP
jgi:hypothetical protein